METTLPSVRAFPRWTATPRAKLIGGPLWDLCFIYGTPFIGLAFAYLVYYLSPLQSIRVVPGYFVTWDILLISTLNHAHIALVFWRSHLNPDIFRAHFWRLTLIPTFLVISMIFSQWAFVTFGLLALLWGEYHFSVQTFGFARIYDAKAGNPPARGRLQDYWLAHALYFGPSLMGPNIRRLLIPFDQYTTVGADILVNFPVWVMAHLSTIRMAVIWASALYVVYYAWFTLGLLRAGHRPSFQKWSLLAVTGATSYFAWGYLPLHVAIFVMHFFHCIQYFALVWRMENLNLSRWGEALFRIDARRAKALILFGTVVLTGTYGVFAVMARALPDARGMILMVVTVSMCHIWFDGFIWSVRRGQV